MYPNWNYWNWKNWNWKNWNKVISNVDTPGLSSPRPIKTARLPVWRTNRKSRVALWGDADTAEHENAHTQDALSSTRPFPESSEAWGGSMYVGGYKCAQSGLRTKNRRHGTLCTPKQLSCQFGYKREAVRQIALLQIAVCMNWNRLISSFPCLTGSLP